MKRRYYVAIVNTKTNKGRIVMTEHDEGINDIETLLDENEIMFYQEYPYPAPELEAGD